MYNITADQINPAIGTSKVRAKHKAEEGYEALGVSMDSCVIYSKPLNRIVHLTPSKLNDSLTLAMNLGEQYIVNSTGENFLDLRKEDTLAIAKTIIKECHDQGPFDEIQVRGRGFWTAEDGTILVNGTTLTDLNGNAYPRRNGKYIYEAAGAVNYQPDTVAADENVGRAFYDLSTTFAFINAPVAAMRYIGYIGCAYMPGILPWRSSFMIQGQSGLGKSALGKTTHWFLGPELSMRFTASDTSVPGVRNSIASNAVAMVLDEMEASEQTSKILAYNRNASEGINGVKSTQAGKRMSHSGRASFMFGGIHPPKMEEADSNRLVMVKLQEMKKRKDRHFLFADEFNLAKQNDLTRLGAGMCARMIRRAKELISKAYEIKEFMLAQGYKDRICDTYAPIVSSAWIFLNDAEMRQEDMAAFLDKFAIEKLTEATSLAQNMLANVLNTSIRTESNNLTTLSYVIRDYVEAMFDRNKGYIEVCESILGIYGIKPELRVNFTDKELSKLAILVKNRNNENLMKLAPQESRQALDFDGVLMQQPGATREENGVRISKVLTRAVRIPLDLNVYYDNTESGQLDFN